MGGLDGRPKPPNVRRAPAKPGRASVVARSYFDDAVAITRQMKELDINPKMFGVTVGGDPPEFYDLLKQNAKYVYGAVKRGGTFDPDRVRDVLLALDTVTVFGHYKVDADGFQVGHKMVTAQWQDGAKVIVWPEELATGKPRFPTPPWSQR